MTIHEAGNAWVYPTLVTLSLALAFLVPTARVIPAAHRRKYHVVQLFTLLGAIFGAKLALLMGDKGWPFVAITWRDVVFSGRSITGALIFGLAFGEMAKPLVGYTLPPNDHFAAKVPFSIALGRVGCLFAGCCRGLPYEGAFSVRYDDGVSRYPAQAIEVAFQLAVGALFVVLVRRRALRGRVFSLYLVLYGAFRFATEFLRETPKPFGALSVYQALSVVMIVLGATFLALRRNASSAVTLTSPPQEPRVETLPS